MKSPAILSRARPRQGRAGSNASNSSTSLARKAAMSPMSRDSISTGRTASGTMDAGTSRGRALFASPVSRRARRFHAAAASAGVDCIGPRALQCRFSQTTQELPCTARLTKTSSLPQNGQGNSSLTLRYPLHLMAALSSTRRRTSGHLATSLDAFAFVDVGLLYRSPPRYHSLHALSMVLKLVNPR
jgi:hypothetical protein